MPDRKYISEFGLHMVSNRVVVLQQSHLDEISEHDFEAGCPCHLYAIARRPRVTLEPDSVCICEEWIAATVKVHTRPEQQVFDLQIPNDPTRPVTRVICEYPHSEVQLVDAAGLPILEGFVINFLAFGGVVKKYPEIADLEVLYVGRAYGRDGKRTPVARLSSHETLQKIYAEAIRRSPDMDVWLILFGFEELLVSSVDGRAAASPATDEVDDAHIEVVMAGTPISAEQRVNYTEAALIRYFEPPYNDEYKATFPSPSHKSYAECYALDLNAVSIEINTEDHDCRLWSQTVPPEPIHLKFFALNSEQERRWMFEEPFGSSGFQSDGRGFEQAGN